MGAQSDPKVNAQSISSRGILKIVIPKRCSKFHAFAIISGKINVFKMNNKTK